MIEKQAETFRAAIVGAGWYGCHIALELKKKGYDITIYEANSESFSNVSGNFGIRLHAGPHYPRSIKTRQTCQKSFEEFITAYPELVVEHSQSIYALGIKDADEKPPKVSKDEFEKVCKEFNYIDEVDLSKSQYTNLLTAMDIKEPSIKVGKGLREKFEKYLEIANIKINYNHKIDKIEECDDKVKVFSKGKYELFDYVINATSYQDLLPNKNILPFDIKMIYQPCLALIYTDKFETKKPFSFIVMDGWFPCLMPYCDTTVEQENHQRYILTHGKWTIMGSYERVDEAKKFLSGIDDVFIEKNVRPNCEEQMKRFWPTFTERFTYSGWKGTTLAKPPTNREFRSAITYATKSRKIIFVTPGKVANVIDAGYEVSAIINNDNILIRDKYCYVQGGVLDNSLRELTEPIEDLSRNTCMLQTYTKQADSPRTFYRRNSSTFFQPASLLASAMLPEKINEEKEVKSSMSSQFTNL